MGTSKKEKFTESQNDLAIMAKAMGHPARIAIIQYLLKREGCVCGEIVEEIGLAQSTVSQHLKELKSSGIIKGDIEGASVCYCMNYDYWKRAGKKFTDFLGQIGKKCC